VTGGEREVVIACEGVRKTLGRQQVLRGMDLEVRRGECLVVMGRSGCGKSVLLKHIIGLMTPDAGRILVEGKDVASMTEREMLPIRQEVGIVFQGGALFDSMSVGENIAFPLREERELTETQIQERVEDVLDAVGLSGQQRKATSDLSGGMRKRVALARTIARRPKVVLYDEPTTGLDPITTDSIDRLINKMRERYGVTSVVVTHDMHSAFSVGDRLALMHEGRVYCQGTVDELRSNPDPVVHNFIHGISEESEVTV